MNVLLIGNGGCGGIRTFIKSLEYGISKLDSSIQVTTLSDLQFYSLLQDRSKLEEILSKTDIIHLNAVPFFVVKEIIEYARKSEKPLKIVYTVHGLVRFDFRYNNNITHQEIDRINYFASDMYSILGNWLIGQDLLFGYCGYNTILGEMYVPKLVQEGKIDIIFVFPSKWLFNEFVRIYGGEIERWDIVEFVKDRSLIVPNGTYVVDCIQQNKSIFEKHRKEIRELLNNPNYIIVFPHRLDPRKHPIEVVEAFCKAIQYKYIPKNAKLIMAGAPIALVKTDIDVPKAIKYIAEKYSVSFVDLSNYKGNLREKLQKNKDLIEQANIIYLGELEHEDTLYLIAASDIMLQPTEYENCSYSAIEAVSLGTPLAITNRAGAKEYFVDTRWAIPIQDPNDTGELLSIIHYTYRNKENLKKYFNKVQKSACEVFSAKTMANKYLEIYNKLLQSQRQYIINARTYAGKS